MKELRSQLAKRESDEAVDVDEQQRREHDGARIQELQDRVWQLQDDLRKVPAAAPAWIRGV